MFPERLFHFGRAVVQSAQLHLAVTKLFCTAFQVLDLLVTVVLCFWPCHSCLPACGPHTIRACLIQAPMLPESGPLLQNKRSCLQDRTTFLPLALGCPTDCSDIEEHTLRTTLSREPTVEKS